MAINPYTTPADYKYVPIPFREMAAAGAQADKRLGNLFENAAKINQNILYRRGDAEAARQEWASTQKKLQDLTNNIYKDPSKYKQHARDLYGLSAEVTDPFGKRAALAKRYQQEEQWKKTIDENKGIGGTRYGEFLKSQIGAKALDFDATFDPVTGQAADITLDYQYGIPNYLDNSQTQAELNTIADNLHKTLIQSGELDENAQKTYFEGVNSGKTVYTALQESGITPERIRAAMALAIKERDDLIGSAQLRTDTDAFQMGVQSGTDESNFFSLDPNGNVVFDTNTELGSALEGLTIAKAYKEEKQEKVEVANVKDKKSEYQKQAEKDKAKKAAIWEPGFGINSPSAPINPTTPQKVYEALEGDGTDDNKGLNNELRQLEDQWEKHKSGKHLGGGLSAEDASKLNGRLQYTRKKIKAYEAMLEPYQKQTKAYIKQKKLLTEEGKFEYTHGGKKKYQLDDDYTPTAKVQMAEDILNSKEYKEWLADQEISVYARDEGWSHMRQPFKKYLESNGHKDLWEEIYNSEDDNDLNYLQNVYQYNRAIKNSNIDIKNELEKISDEMLESSEGITIQIQTLPELSGKEHTKLDPGYKYSDLIRMNPTSFRFYGIGEDGTFGDIDEKILEQVKSADSWEAEKDSPTKKPYFEMVGVTKGNDMLSESGHPYLVMNLRNGTDGKIIKQMYVEPKDPSNTDIYTRLESDYAKSAEYRGVNEQTMGDIKQAERMHYMPYQSTLSDSFGGYRLHLGEHPMAFSSGEKVPGTDYTMPSYQVYSIPMNRGEVIQYGNKEVIKVDGVDLNGNSVSYFSPKIPDIQVVHGSDGTIKAMLPGDYTFDLEGNPVQLPGKEPTTFGSGKEGWMEFNEWAKKKMAYYDAGARMSSQLRNGLESLAAQQNIDITQISPEDRNKLIQYAVNSEMQLGKVAPRMTAQVQEELYKMLIPYIGPDGSWRIPYHSLADREKENLSGYSSPTNDSRATNTYQDGNNTTMVGTSEPTVGGDEYVPPVSYADKLEQEAANDTVPNDTVPEAVVDTNAVVPDSNLVLPSDTNTLMNTLYGTPDTVPTNDTIPLTNVPLNSINTDSIPAANDTIPLTNVPLRSIRTENDDLENIVYGGDTLPTVEISAPASEKGLIARYNRQLADFKSKGYYINENGKRVKSAPKPPAAAASTQQDVISTIDTTGSTPKLPIQQVEEDAAQANIADITTMSDSLKNEQIVTFNKNIPATTDNGKMLKTIENLRNKTYELGSKSGNNIDCSAFVYKVLTENGYNVSTVDLSSQGLWATSSNQKTYSSGNKNKVMTKEQLAKVPKNLKPGTVIAFDTGQYEFDKNRKWGIDHIGVIVHDSKGKAYIAESAQGKEGVALTPLDKRLDELSSKLVSVYTGVHPKNS